MTIDLGETRLAPAVFLAPMAGITDRPTRDLVGRFGAGLVVSEMIASCDVLNARRGSLEKAELGTDVAGTAVQIAGREAGPMAEAARRLEACGARLIDINMGCPAKKVTAGLSGSALMRDPDHALRLIEAVTQAVRVPVTLKTRLGWDEGLRNAAQIARRAEGAGIVMVTIHGRTRCQFYKGRADWAAIRAVTDAVKIPVIANGDITGAQSAAQALAASGARGVMVGRGARGRPWLLAQIAHALYDTPAPAIPYGGAFGQMVAAHYDALLRFYGRAHGGRVARKHLGWYLDQTSVAPAHRREILTSNDPARTLAWLARLRLARPEDRAIAA